MWTLPALRSSEADEAELPVLAAGRGRGRRPRRSGRRGGSSGSSPASEELAVRERGAGGHLVGDRAGRRASGDGVGGAEHEGVGAVGERRGGRYVAGLGLLEQRGQQQHRLGGAGVADACAFRSSITAAFRPRARGDGLAARACGPATATRPTSAASTPGVASAAFKAAGRAARSVLAEVLLPLPGCGRRRACASGRGTRRCAWPAPTSSARTGPSASRRPGRRRRRRRPRPRRASRAARCGRRRRPRRGSVRRRRGRRRRARDRRAGAAHHVGGEARRRQAEGGVDGRGVGLVGVGRGRWWRTRSGLMGRAGVDRSAGRAASTASVVASSS